MEKTYRWGRYALMYFAFLIYSLSTVCAKFAAQESDFTGVIVFVAIEILLLGVYAVLWQQVLKHFPLVIAMSNKGSVILISMMWSVALFNENVTSQNIIGAMCICFGIWMVSKDE